MKEKSLTFCFFKLKGKEKANVYKIIRGRVAFLWKILVFFFKVNVYSTKLFAEAVVMEWWKRITRDYHQKLNVRVALQIAEEFRTNNLKK